MYNAPSSSAARSPCSGSPEALSVIGVSASRSRTCHSVLPVSIFQTRSVLAVPLVARGEPLGVVYLDDRVRRGAFGARELSWVSLVATLAALAIADARDQLLLRRAAREGLRFRTS